jgi:1,4-alpha-glucan branching enzyme
VNRYWIDEYHTDGYRFDLTKGYTQTYSGNDVGMWQQYDASRVAILERMVDSIWAFDSTSIIIFEHLSDNPEQIELSNHGIMLWGNMNNEYNQCTMGYNSNNDVSWVSYQARGWSNANLVGYMESHDEERLMYKNELYGDSIAGYNAKKLDTALQRMECAGALFFPVPGPKMIWQFGERGYDISINQFCRICAKPMHWEYMKNASRVHEYKVWAALIKLKTTYAPFATTNYNIDMTGVVKRIRLYHPQFNVISIGNFDVVDQAAYPVYNHTGWWYEYFTGDSVNVTDVNMHFSFRPGEYRLYTDVRLPAPDLTVPAAPNGVEEIALTRDHITVYPVPSSGVIHFDADNGQSIGKITIYDLQGREVYSQSYEVNQASISVNMPIFAVNGLYLYTLSVDGTLHNGRFSYFK